MTNNFAFPEWLEQLSSGLAKMDIQLPAEQQQLLLDFLALLNKWNKAFNLTAIRDPKIMVSRQLLDSLSIHELIQPFSNLLDVGTGPGLPGIPLAICNPEKSFTLIDSNGKKTRFVQQAINELGLGNVQVHNQRVEQLANDELFDCITSRAFASVEDMINGTDHLLAKDGHWMAMKSHLEEAERKAIPENITFTGHELNVPGEVAKRQVLDIQRCH